MAKNENEVIIGISADISNVESSIKKLEKSIKDATKNAVFGVSSGSSIEDEKKKLVSLQKELKRLNDLQNKVQFDSLSHSQRMSFERIKLKQIEASKLLEIEKQHTSQVNSLAEKQLQSLKARHDKASLILKQSHSIELMAEKQKYQEINNLNKASIRQQSKDRVEYSKTFMGSITEGTTFGHKFATTAQYAMAGAGIYSVAGAVTSLKDSIVEADKYLHMFQGVLEMSAIEAKTLQQDIFNVGKEIGGTSKGMSEAALMFGRAGIENDKLALSLKVSSMAANISGDSIENITEMLAAWTTVYPKENLEHLGDVMTKIANESLLSFDGLKIATSYITASGAAAGVSADQLVALAGAWKMTGKADSIVGTEVRRLFNQIESGSEEVKKAYWAMGIDINKVNNGMKSESKEVRDATFRSFMSMMGNYDSLSSSQKKNVDKMVSGLAVLDKQTFKSGYIAGQEFKRMETASDNASGSLEKASDKIALSYEKMWERIVFAGKEGATKFEEGFKKSFAGADTTVEEFNLKMIAFDESVNKAMLGVGSGLGELSRTFSEVVGGAVRLGEAIYYTFGDNTFVKGIAAVTAATYLWNTALLANPLVRLAVAGISLVGIVSSKRDEIISASNDNAKASGFNNFVKDMQVFDKIKNPNEKLKAISEAISNANKQMDNEFLRRDKEFLPALEGGASDRYIKSKQLEIEQLNKLYSSIKNPISSKKIKEKADVGTGGKPMPDFSDDKTPKQLADEAERKAKEDLRLAISLIKRKESELKAGLTSEYEITKLHQDTLDEIYNKANEKRFTQYKSLQDDANNYYKDKMDFQGETLRKQNEINIKTMNEIDILTAKGNLEKAIFEETKIRMQFQLDIAEATAKYQSSIQDKNAKDIRDKEFLLAKDKEKKSFDELAIKDTETLRDLQLEISNSQASMVDGLDSWSSSISSISSEYGNVAKSISNAYKVQLDATNKQEVLDKKYYDLGKKRDKNDIESVKYFADLEKEKTKDQAILDFNNQQEQINMYAGIAGAMSGMFQQGSKEAAAFNIIQTSLAGIAGVNAILEQGKGDPYTSWARMAAMAAVVIPMVQSIGGSIKAFSAGSTSYDSFASIKANEGEGSTLGDSSKASESIKKSLDILGDLAKPEFRLISQMNASLISIDQKIGGLSANILRAGGFATGEGYVGSSSLSGANQFMSSGIGSTALGIGSTALLGMGAGAALGLGSWAALGSFGPIGLAVGAIDNLILGGTLTKFISGAIGSIVNGIFGGDSESNLHDAGITFSKQFIEAAITGLQGQSYQVIRTVTDGGWFHGDDTSFNSYFSTLDEYTRKQFQLVLANLYDTVVLSSEGLDVATSKVKSNLSDAMVDIGKISLTGKTGEQIQETLTSIFGKIGDDLVREAYAVGPTYEEIVAKPAQFLLGYWGMLFANPVYTAWKVAETEFNKTRASSLDSFQQIGEGLFQTMTRVSSGMEEADYYINRLGGSFKEVIYTDIVNKQGTVATQALLQSIVKFDESLYGVSNGVVDMISLIDSSASELYDTYKALDNIRTGISSSGLESKYLSAFMVRGAGGVNELSDGLKNFIDSFLSESDKIAYTTEILRKEFNAAGVSIPSSADEFKKLVQSIDISSDSGQELYGRLITLSDGFNTLQEEIKGSSISSLIEDIKEFVLSLRLETVSSSTITSFTTFSKSFNDMIDAISSGSSDIQSIGQKAIDNAKSYIDMVTVNATAGRDIQFAKQIVANKFESVVLSPDVRLGEVNETLKISLGENSVIVSELRAIVSELTYLNSLTTTQTATQVKTLSATRALIA